MFHGSRFSTDTDGVDENFAADKLCTVMMRNARFAHLLLAAIVVRIPLIIAKRVIQKSKIDGTAVADRNCH